MKCAKMRSDGKGRLARVLDPVALDAAAEGVVGDAELSGGLDAVAVCAAAGLLNEGPFHIWMVSSGLAM